MHESYDDNDDYYEDNYDDGQDYDQNQSDWNKFYFKFDVTNSPLSDWVKKTIDSLFGDKFNLPEVPFVSFPVNDWLSNTVSGGNSLLYLGNNHYNEPIYKAKHFIENKLQNEYTNHLQQYASHFIKQPAYYKGLYDILN
jgi:hypothetical protein